MMDKDKAIRAAKLTAGGILEKNRAKTAVSRAGGQIAPSKYLPNVPRAVHADGGREDGEVVNLGKEKLVRSITKAVSDVKSGAHQERMDQRAYKLHESGRLPLPIGTKVTPPQGWDMPSQLQIHGYWQDILNPDLHGYKLKSEDGDLYEVQHHTHSGRNPYIFGGGFKAYSGPVRNRAEYSDEAMAPRNPILPTRTPEQSDQLNKEYDQLFGTQPDITKADGGFVGKAAFQEGNHPDVPDVLYHGNALQIAKKGWTDEIDPEQTRRNMDAQDFRAFKPSEHGRYGSGIYLSDSPSAASDFAQGIRADKKEAMPFGQVLKLHVSMKQPFTDDTLRHPAWRDHIKDAIKQGLLLGGGNDEDNARAAEITKKLDDGTATVRDLFLTDTQHGAMVNQFGQQNIHKTIRNSGFDGIIAHRPDGTKEYVAFKPEQIKSAIGNSGKFDPTDPDMTKAEGGAVTDTDEFRNWFGNSVTHTNGEPHVFYTGTSKDKDFTSHNVGRHGAWFVRDPEAASSYAEQNDSQGYKREGFKLTPTNTASRVIPAYVKAENPYTGELPEEYLRDNYKSAQSEWFDTLRAKGHDSWVPASQNGNLVVALKEPQQIKSIFNNGKFDPNQKHMNKAAGGEIEGGTQMDNNNVTDLSTVRTMRDINSGNHSDNAQSVMSELNNKYSESQKAFDMAHASGAFDNFQMGDTYKYKGPLNYDPDKIVGFTMKHVSSAPNMTKLFNNHYPAIELEKQNADRNVKTVPLEWFENNLHKYEKIGGRPRIVKAGGGKALALTRRFTKNGIGATMTLKPRGK